MASPLARRAVSDLLYVTLGQTLPEIRGLGCLKDETKSVNLVSVFWSGAQAGGNNVFTQGDSFPD